MPDLLICPCGHRWTPAADEEREPFCPVCGEPVKQALPAPEAIAARPVSRPVLPRPRLDDDEDPPPRPVRRQPKQTVGSNVNLIFPLVIAAFGFLGAVGLFFMIRAARTAARVPAAVAPPANGIEYYDDVVFRHGVPQGMTPRFGAQIGQCGSLVRVTRRGGLIGKIEFLDGNQNPIERDSPERCFVAHPDANGRRPESSVTFTYSSAGGVKQQTAFDRHGAELWTFTYTSATTAVYKRNGEPYAPPWLGSAYVSIAWSPGGWEAETTLTDAAGKLVANADGVAIFRRQYDGRGFLREETFHDADGKPRVAPSRGYAGYRCVHDERGWLREATTLGADLRPAKCRLGFATFRAEQDWARKEVTHSYFDERDEPVTVPQWGLSRRVLHHDGRGNWTEDQHFGTDGKPAIKNGCSGYRYTYDAAGNRDSVACLGPAGELVLSGSGYAIYREKFDSDRRVVELSYFDTKERPLNGKHGYARMTTKYDANGRPRERAYFDANGEPVPSRVWAVHVTKDSPAAKAGLRAGDVLVSYGGKPVTTVAALTAAASAEPADGPKPLVVERRGKSVTLQVERGWWEEDLQDYVPAGKK